MAGFKEGDLVYVPSVSDARRIYIITKIIEQSTNEFHRFGDYTSGFVIKRKYLVAPVDDKSSGPFEVDTVVKAPSNIARSHSPLKKSLGEHKLRASRDKVRPSSYLDDNYIFSSSTRDAVEDAERKQREFLKTLEKNTPGFLSRLGSAGKSTLNSMPGRTPYPKRGGKSNTRKNKKSNKSRKLRRKPNLHK